MPAVHTPAHEEILKVALRLCRERGDWNFSAVEIVRALPHLNERTVRTHVVSRCCTNAPKNHPHKWDYFRRVRRGVYEILPRYRKGSAPHGHTRGRMTETAVSEVGAVYQESGARPLRPTIHALVQRDRGYYVAECMEVAVVTQGRSLDELVENLREALALHLEGEDLERLGISRTPRLAITYELSAAPDGVEA